MTRPDPDSDLPSAAKAPAPVLRGISSMATRLVLAELAQAHAAAGGRETSFESVGGVDAAKRVAAGEAFDVVVLAADAIAKLEAAGHLLPGSTLPLTRSGVAVAVPGGAPLPDLSSLDTLCAALRAAPSIGYSTGPSGTQLLKLFEQWGLSEALAGRLVQAPPGVPVGSLVARGEVALGFQQLSELIHQSGIRLATALPPEAQIETVFSGAVCRTAADPEAARALLAYMASAEATEAKRRQGMDPA